MKNILNVNKASLKATLMSSIIVFSTFTFCSAIINKVACAGFKEITLDEWNAIDLDYINHDPELDEWSNKEHSFKEITLHDWNNLYLGPGVWPGQDPYENEGSGITPEDRNNLYQGIGVLEYANLFCYGPPFEDGRIDPTLEEWYNDENGREFTQVDGVEEYIKYFKDVVRAYENSPKNKQGWLNAINGAANNKAFSSEEDRETFVSNKIQELDEKILGGNPEEWPDRRNRTINDGNECIEILQGLQENGTHSLGLPSYSKEDGENWENFNSLFQQGGSSNPEENQLNLSKTEAQNDEYEYYYEEKEEEETSDSTENQPNEDSFCNIA